MYVCDLLLFYVYQIIIILPLIIQTQVNLRFNL